MFTKMVSLHVKSFFNKVPLDRTSDSVLRRIYDKHELQTSMTRLRMKELLILCTKYVDFTFGSGIKVQNNGVAMDSPLERFLSAIFIIGL